MPFNVYTNSDLSVECILLRRVFPYEILTHLKVYKRKKYEKKLKRIHET